MTIVLLLLSLILTLLPVIPIGQMRKLKPVAKLPRPVLLLLLALIAVLPVFTLFSVGAVSPILPGVLLLGLAVSYGASHLVARITGRLRGEVGEALPSHLDRRLKGAAHIIYASRIVITLAGVLMAIAALTSGEVFRWGYLLVLGLAALNAVIGYVVWQSRAALSDTVHAAEVERFLSWAEREGVTALVQVPNASGASLEALEKLMRHLNGQGEQVGIICRGRRAFSLVKRRYSASWLIRRIPDLDDYVVEPVTQCYHLLTGTNGSHMVLQRHINHVVVDLDGQLARRHQIPKHMRMYDEIRVKAEDVANLEADGKSYGVTIKALAQYETLPQLVQLSEDVETVSDARIALYFSGDYLKTAFHVAMWADHLDASGVPWYVICTHARHFKQVREAGVRAVLSLKPHDHLNAVASSVRAIFYVNNGHRNIEIMERFPELTHVQLLHGDSDKPSSFSPATVNFDKVFVAGQLGQDRYKNNGVTIPDSAFVHVGRPQVKGRQIGMRQGWMESPVVGYMPTWYGAKGDMRFSSLDRGPQIIQAIHRAAPTAEILFKPHPLSANDPNWKSLDRRINAALAETGSKPLDMNVDANEVYARADMLVTDISSTMSDYLYSNRPLAVVMPHGQIDDPHRQFPTLGGCYEIAADLSNIDSQLQDALGADSLADQRSAMRIYAFGDDSREADARFIDAVRQIAEWP
ncbi:CDP-glycerol glycerophosphotransferase family protein [Pararhodobacter oceanensis]|uniref:CDP-glycerol glycerophosphotransferase family protein n=1 Tax=Pararhodobacter oceanensis TaxID=2172121 RepID=UPI003A9041FF